VDDVMGCVAAADGTDDTTLSVLSSTVAARLPTPPITMLSPTATTTPPSRSNMYTLSLATKVSTPVSVKAPGKATRSSVGKSTRSTGGTPATVISPYDRKCSPEGTLSPPSAHIQRRRGQQLRAKANAGASRRTPPRAFGATAARTT
jgi:hypothetical protein